jgi:hypothetical protein
VAELPPQARPRDETESGKSQETARRPIARK